MISIAQSPYEIEESQAAEASKLAVRVEQMREHGSLSPEVLGRLRAYFRIKNIYHSNAIEGNSLDVGETRLVVEQGLTITGKPLRDQAEARNLSVALDFLEELARAADRPITAADVRQIHGFVLRGIDDDNAGRYRNAVVEISGSKYRPTAPESIAAEMETFGCWLQRASVPGVLFNGENAISAAAAAHTWFVMIHPFVDGNGRVARLLMNLILMRYRFPIAVITRDDRLRYYDALEEAQTSDLTPLVALVNECIDESLEEYEVAAQEHRERIEWAASIVSKFDEREKIRASNQYEVWKSAMDLLKSVFRQTAEMLNATAVGNIYFKDFGNLEFEKYLSLKNHGSAKRTWYFRVDFRNQERAARYLFFFGSSSYLLRQETDVTLHLSREEPPGSFFYQRLDAITAPNVPNLVELGYKQSSESFVVRGHDNRLREEKADILCRKFVQDVVDRHFGG